LIAYWQEFSPSTQVMMAPDGLRALAVVSRDADECWRLDNEPTLYKTLPEAQRAAERRLENIL
jgi:hypothetical protein